MVDLTIVWLLTFTRSGNNYGQSRASPGPAPVPVLPTLPPWSQRKHRGRPRECASVQVTTDSHVPTCHQATGDYGSANAKSKICQWEFQDPKLEVLYHLRPYFVGIFPYIGHWYVVRPIRSSAFSVVCFQQVVDIALLRHSRTHLAIGTTWEWTWEWTGERRRIQTIMDLLHAWVVIRDNIIYSMIWYNIIIYIYIYLVII